MLLVVLACLALLCSPTQAIKFDIPAKGHSVVTRCIWNYALADTLVIVTVNNGPMPDSKVDAAGQQLDVEIVDASKHNNVYLHKRDVSGETRMAINTHSNSDLGVCFTNRLKKGEYDDAREDIDSRLVCCRWYSSSHDLFSRRPGASKAGESGMSIDLDVDIGADAVDYNAIANQESLSGLETEMRKLEAVAQEILDGMSYLKKREEKMRGTNESTNSRVQNFASLTLLALVALGIWQMWHLRSFFRRKYLID